MKWTGEQEEKLLQLKDEHGESYRTIAAAIGTTVSSVKHKYIRLKQAANEHAYHHPKEKTEQIKRVLQAEEPPLFILETHAGYGNLTEVYRRYGMVTCHDVDAKKIDHLRAKTKVVATKADSEKEIHKYIYRGMTFDVVDLDPYGFPSRFFPHVFLLLKDGFLFFTFPKMGVQQVNKIMLEHYRVFWDITLNDKDEYAEKIDKRVKDYAMQHFRKVRLLDILDLGRMYRFVYRVEHKSAFELFGYNHLSARK